MRAAFRRADPSYGDSSLAKAEFMRALREVGFGNLDPYSAAEQIAAELLAICSKV